MKIKKLFWKVRKLIQPELVQQRNSYIQSNINECERIKKWMGEENFNKHWGKDYIENLEKDLV